MARSWFHPGADFIDFSLENVVFRENQGFQTNMVSRRSLARSGVDFGDQKASSWDAFDGQVGVGKGVKNYAKKGIVLTSSWAGVEAAPARSL